MAHTSATSNLNKPIVGVIVASTMVQKLNAQNRNFWSYIRFKMLVQANEKAKDTVYVFSPGDIDFSRRRVRGTYFNTSKSRWETAHFPIPDVLYVRGAEGEALDHILKKFKRIGVKTINPIYAFNKWDLHHKLSQHENIRPFLPYTVRIEDLDDLKNVLENRSEIYIKGCRGSRGKRVMRVVKLSEGGYEYSYHTSRLVRREVTDVEHLWRAVGKFFGSKKIIAQQAIDLLTTEEGRRIDLRAEVQRDKRGKIKIVGIPIRVGHRNSPITIHAYAFKFDDQLENLFPRYSRQEIMALKRKIIHFLKSVYRAVEKSYGKFGEIGIDFGLDKNGDIWLIECNAKSAKVSIRKAYGTKALRKTYLNPLQYAKFLARK